MINGADGHDQEYTPDQDTPVQLLGAFHHHEAYDQLWLGEAADADAQDERGDEGVPLRRPGHRHGRPSLVSYLLKPFRNKRGDFRQFPVGFDEAHIHHPVEPEQQEQHAGEHDDGLQSVCV